MDKKTEIAKESQLKQSIKPTKADSTSKVGASTVSVKKDRKEPVAKPSEASKIDAPDTQQPPPEPESGCCCVII